MEGGEKRPNRDELYEHVNSIRFRYFQRLCTFHAQISPNPLVTQFHAKHQKAIEIICLHIR